MPRTILNPATLHPAPGYSHIAVATGGRLAFVAGQVALDPDFSLVGGDDLAAQTRKAMENLGLALAELDAGWDDVVKATVYTTRPTEYETIGAAMAEAMGAAAPPAQVLLGVTSLALPELLIEIELVVSLPLTVRAVRMHAHGGPEVLRLETVPEPVPGPRDLLVRLRATSVNHRDVWIRKGHRHPAYHVDLPAVLGIDVCGDVVDAGDEVEGFRPGDRVTASPYMQCGSCGACVRGRFQYCPRFTVYTGTYAELFLVPADFAVVVDPSVPDEHVAAFPNTYVTAWQMLVGKAGVSAADTVFVWAATSGLGSAAVEIAQLAGATVLASAGTEAKRAVLRGRTAGPVLDHHAPDLVERVLEATGGEGASIVFEHVGQATWGRSLELCAPGGTIVSAGATSGDDARMNITYMFAKQLRILGSRLGTMEDTLAAVRHLSAGRFRPLIGPILPLERVAEAHRLLEEGAVVGKVIVRP